MVEWKADQKKKESFDITGKKKKNEEILSKNHKEGGQKT